MLQIAHAFSGSKGQAPKFNIRDFLPYPDWREDGAQRDKPDEYTRLILAQLSKNRLIPNHVMIALLSPPEHAT